MKIIISGAFGFVGRNLIEYFSKDESIRIIAVDLQQPPEYEHLQYYEWKNLYDIEAEPSDIIIHLAGLAHDTKATNEASYYFEINVGLTKKIFDYFMQSSANKFVFFSSVKAAADTLHGTVLTEDIIPNPHTPYGRSKLEAEQYILSKPIPEAKRVYILRPAMIHGPGNKGNLNLLYSILRRGIPYPLGAFQNERSFTTISNLLFLLGRLLELEVESGVYNVCDDENLSTSEIVQLINKSLGKPDKIWGVPQSLVRILANIGDIIHLPLNSERLEKLTESYVVSNQKIKEAIRIESLPVNASAGLAMTLDSF